MIVAMTKAADVLKQYDLKSVNSVVFGASPLSMETISFFSDLLSGCSFLQGYGLTETCCIVTFTSPDDAVFGSCGNLLPGVEARLIDKNGQEISQHNCPGELFIRSPSVVLGYYGNEEASKNMLTDDGWLRTGDLVEFRQSPEGHSHLFVIDRLKELIKVRVGYNINLSFYKYSHHPGYASCSSGTRNIFVTASDGGRCLGYPDS
jgi:long-subunit acyl-CoA synthetase (AMP-forming)